MAAAEVSGQSGEPAEYLVVGEIVAPFGKRGEVKVLLETDFPELVLEARHLYIGDPAVRRAVEWARQHGRLVRLKLVGCDRRGAAEALRGQCVQVSAAEAPVPGEGEYYYHQLIGLPVWTTERELLGEVVEIFRTGSNDVLVVRGAPGEILLPMIDEIVREVDLPGGRILVHLLEGLR